MKTTTPKENKTCKELLPYTFTQSELLDLARSMAQTARKLEAAQDDKKSVTSQLSANIAKLQAELNVFTEKISSGKELRSTDCHWKLNHPGPKKKTLYRDDNGEIVRTVNMTMEETKFEFADKKPTS